MKKVALVFVLAVFVPSLVLAWLAIRSLRDQQFVLERQQSLLFQSATDAFAKEVNEYLADEQRAFNFQVETLMADVTPRNVIMGFDERLRQTWPLAEVGFCVTLAGNLVCPSPNSGPAAAMFCVENGRFLGNRESAEVYWNDYSKGGSLNNNISSLGQNALANVEPNNGQAASVMNSGKVQARKVNPAQQIAPSQTQTVTPNPDNISKIVPAEAEFRQLIGDTTDGMIARFLQNKLKLMFWHRLEKDPGLVFGAQLDLARVTEHLRLMVAGRIRSPTGYDEPAGPNRLSHNLPELTRPSSILPDDICLAVVDDNAKLVAVSDPIIAGFLDGKSGARARDSIETEFRNVCKTDVKHPFVATEIGEALPHWEVAAYWKNPDKLKQAAQSAQLMLGLLIAILVLAIGLGSWMIVHCLNVELKLARQKTDFVSNVSHELKTPLTSIRMFSELLADGRVEDAAKQRSYLNIITAEAARLTRLINNVLDFSRMERGEKKYNFQPCDLTEVVRTTAETFRPHLETSGFKFDCEFPNSSVLVQGDGDALSQVIVNLLSNAEKYSGAQKEIALEVQRQDTPLPHIDIKVLDRGPGLPRGCEEKVFEKFYRAHDSLSSGIQGSGLGLTIARQIARAHGGDVVYEPRAGGGSCFILRLPIAPPPGGNKS